MIIKAVADIVIEIINNTVFYNLYGNQGWIYWGGGGGVLFFMIKQKIIRDKMRYSNLINEL